MSSKGQNLSLLAMAQLCAMALWFSASAVVDELGQRWQLVDIELAWLTMSVQLGFVLGALVSALLNLADRFDSRYLFIVCALLGALFNALIVVLDTQASLGLWLRFLTGVMLAGVYPTGMKIMATWCKEDRGFGLGLLVGALTLGSALPHLLRSGFEFEVTDNTWQWVLLSSSLVAVLASVMMALGVKIGPHHHQAAAFHWKFAKEILSHRPTRLANFAYLGHMWELYAMWAWCPLFLLESFRRHNIDAQWAGLAAFAVIGIGAIGCILGGKWADRYGRSQVAGIFLALSGSSAFCIGFFFDQPLLALIIAFIWGLTVIADSAQFSATVSELTDARYLGTALTLQTCMGFLLTLVTIQLIPLLQPYLGYRYVFMVLAIGPLFGIVCLYRLEKIRAA